MANPRQLTRQTRQRGIWARKVLTEGVFQPIYRGNETNAMNIWSRLGISVAVIGIYCILLNAVFASKVVYELYRWQFLIVLAATGKTFWVIGKFLSRKEPQPAVAETRRVDTADPEYEEVGKPATPGANFRYWGVMLMIMAGIVVVIVPDRQVVEARTVPATNNQPEPTNASPETAVVEPPPPPPPPATFPEGKLQGLGFSNGKATAIIDGHTYELGEHFENAKIIRIDKGGVLLELEGQYKLITFEKDFLR